MARTSAALSSPAGVDQRATSPTRRPSRLQPTRRQHRHEALQRVRVRRVAQRQLVALAARAVQQQHLRVHRHDVRRHLARGHDGAGIEHILDRQVVRGRPIRRAESRRMRFVSRTWSSSVSVRSSAKTSMGHPSDLRRSPAVGRRAPSRGLEARRSEVCAVGVRSDRRAQGCAAGGRGVPVPAHKPSTRRRHAAVAVTRQSAARCAAVKAIKHMCAILTGLQPCGNRIEDKPRQVLGVSRILNRCATSAARVEQRVADSNESLMPCVL